MTGTSPFSPGTLKSETITGFLTGTPSNMEDVQISYVPTPFIVFLMRYLECLIFA